MNRPLFSILTFVSFAVTLFIFRDARAAAIPLALPPSVVATASGYATTAAANIPSISGGAYPGGMTTQVAGRAITVPATVRVAANAASVVGAAVRLNPTGLVVGAVVTWLGTYAIQYLNDEFVVPEPGDYGEPILGKYWRNNYSPSGVCFGSELGQCSWKKAHDDIFAAFKSNNPSVNFFIQWENLQQAGGNYIHTMRYRNNNGTDGTQNFTFTPYGSSSIPMRPATEADWAPVLAGPLPDAVANQVKDTVSIPVVLELGMSPLNIPLSDPYVDPVTGKRYRDMARITPNPANPTTADLQVYKQEVDPAGNPEVDPETNEEKSPEESDDPCLEHPNRVGCMDAGEIPDGPDLEENSKTISIAADTGWGADTAACPADLTAVTRNGGVGISFSFKPVCDGADMFRPVVIGLAWVTAVLIALGIGRRDTA